MSIHKSSFLTEFFLKGNEDDKSSGIKDYLIIYKMKLTEKNLKGNEDDKSSGIKDYLIIYKMKLNL